MSEDTQVKREDSKAIHDLFYEYHYADDLGVIKSKLAEYVATARREEGEAVLAVICAALCGTCANIANGIGLLGPRTLFGGHWVHLWKETNTYAERCAADVAIRALEASATEKGETNA